MTVVVAPWCAGAIVSSEEPPVRLTFSYGKKKYKGFNILGLHARVVDAMASFHPDPKRQRILPDINQYRYTTNQVQPQSHDDLVAFLNSEQNLAVNLNLRHALPIDEVCQQVRVKNFKVECRVFHAQGQEFKGFKPIRFSIS